MRIMGCPETCCSYRSTPNLTSLLPFASRFLSAKVTTSLSAKSPAVPFLPYPEGVRGYVGDDIAFDPLGISNYFPMDYLRESELK
jgi:hypothetical protein